MSDPYLGELRLMSFATPPKGWALCNGQTLQIAQNQALFSLLGTTYGGNGQTTFMLPDLRGRTPLHPDSTLPAGTPGGQEAVTLSAQQMPAHNHGLNASSEFADSNSPAGALPATKGRGGIDRYAPADNSASMDTSAIALNAGGQGHANMQPFQTLSWAIALVGVFPSRD
ncbi:phage tail protein [Roseateles puraquae]|uniref:Phage tail protein n=1 Tax=Roseateles puraquae TaxID=431059 RepID=A0A254N9G6_9BURK|nr:tail fiber protein [Roseateles puraquae]MDG0855624.1 phage tail protein [Roseateles puraquae]OWR04669.1 phage tail protein [Roseateles puraquae]